MVTPDLGSDASGRYCHVWTLPSMQGLFVENSDSGLQSTERYEAEMDPLCRVVGSYFMLISGARD